MRVRKKVTIEVYVETFACARCGREEACVPRNLETVGQGYSAWTGEVIPEGALVAVGHSYPSGWQHFLIPGDQDRKVCPACAPGVRSAVLQALDRLAEGGER